MTGILKKNEKTGFFDKKNEKSHTLCKKVEKPRAQSIRLSFHLRPEKIGTKVDKQIVGTFSFANIPSQNQYFERRQHCLTA